MEKIIQWGSSFAPFLIASPMAIFGFQHFIYLGFVAGFIPEWIPWRTFWACFTGIALIASALSITIRIWDRWAATLLGSMIFLWVVMLHTSRIWVQPTDFDEWRGIFQALTMSGCAFALAQSIAMRRRGAGELKAQEHPLMGVYKVGSTLAPYFVGGGMAALGVEHFIFPSVTAPQVPVWLPGTILGNYLIGLVLFALGVAICLQRTRRQASMILGVVIFLSMLIFHLPVVLQSARFESDWTKTLVMAGGAFIVASFSRRSQPTIRQNELAGDSRRTALETLDRA